MCNHWLTKNRLIFLLTIILLGLVLLANTDDEIPQISTDDEIPQNSMVEFIQTQDFVVQLRSGEGVENIRIWESEEGDCYVFLPGYAKMEQISLLPGKSSVVIAGRRISGETTSENFNFNEAYPFSYVREGVNVDTTLTFVQSDNVASMHIDTQSGKMDFIHEKKKNEESGSVRLYTEEGELNYRGGLDFIKGRGNSTWEELKKPYSIKLLSNADLLGMGSADKWILLANASDASHIRYEIGLEMARKTGMEYTPDSRWVDLYLNGAYAGLYQLTERNEVHTQRVDISYSNSFLVAMERGDRLAEQGYPYISTEGGSYFRIHHSSFSKTALTRIWQSVENALLAEDGVDPVTGKSWEELIDIDSWAMRFLVDEVMANFDGGSISQFFYYDASDGTEKIKAGPVWDMDNILLAGLGSFQEPNVIAAHREHTMWDTEVLLFSLLYQKEAFRERMIELYQQIVLPWAKDFLDTEIEQYADTIAGAANMNRIRWNTMDPGTDTEDIRTYLEERISFLNDYWLGNTEYCMVYLIQYDWPWDCLAIRSGETIPNVIEDPEGWRVLATGEPFDLSQPIFENITLVQGEVDFQEAKEMYDDILTEEDSETFFITVQGTLILLLFLMAIVGIDLLRSNLRKKRK